MTFDAVVKITCQGSSNNVTMLHGFFFFFIIIIILRMTCTFLYMDLYALKSYFFSVVLKALFTPPCDLLLEKNLHKITIPATALWGREDEV